MAKRTSASSRGAINTNGEQAMKYFLAAVLVLLGVSLHAQPTIDTTPPDDVPAVAEEPPQTADQEGSGADPVDQDSGTVEEPGPGEEEEPGETEKSFFESGVLGLLRDGGLFMWPLVIMAILATGVIIERYRSLKMVNTSDAEVKARIHELLRDNKIEEALNECESRQGPVPAVLSSGLRKYYVLKRLDYDASRIESQVVKAMDDYSVHIVAALEKHLGILATISSVAPMLGFLGTVQGMIVAFKDIVAQMGETNIVEAAASGIQVSLLTTCFGLIVGIPAYVAFNYFTGIINRSVLDLEESATELIESVTLQLAVSGDR
jgi:biopolymer transport protein ExbB